MSLAPEAAAFLGRPPSTRNPNAKAVHGYAGGLMREDPPAPTEAPEKPMPRGVYPRKKKAEKPAQEKAPKKRGPKPKAALRQIRALVDKAPAAARFGVFDDGTIEFRLPTCSGIIQPTEAREFLGFLKRIGVE